MAMEDASARVEYYFGCDYTVKSGESYTVNAEACCLALGLPEEPVIRSLHPSTRLGSCRRSRISRHRWRGYPHRRRPGSPPDQRITHHPPAREK